MGRGVSTDPELVELNGPYAEMGLSERRRASSHGGPRCSSRRCGIPRRRHLRAGRGASRRSRSSPSTRPASEAGRLGRSSTGASTDAEARRPAAIQMLGPQSLGRVTRGGSEIRGAGASSVHLGGTRRQRAFRYAVARPGARQSDHSLPLEIPQRGALCIGLRLRRPASDERAASGSTARAPRRRTAC